MNCQEAIPLIHEYLDGDLQGSRLLELNNHVRSCGECKAQFTQLQKTEAMVAALPKSQPSKGLTERIMRSLPAPKRQNYWMLWVKRHPAATVAAAFLIVMFSSFMSLWNQDTDLIVKGAHLDQVVIQGDTVIVPEGRAVNGNLIVENGKIQVDGEVKGNLVVIDGTLNLASTAYIAGDVTRINQAVDWLWYKIGEIFLLVTH